MNALGNVKNFDGALLYLPIKLPKDRTIFQSAHPNDQSIVTLTIIFKKKQPIKDNISFFNVLIVKVLKALSLIRVGRHDFNPTCAHSVPQHNLEVWPGYITSVNELEGGLILNIDATHRVMRLDTVRDIMTEAFKKNRNNFKEAVVAEILGTSVLTRYNNRVYKVDDIDWDNNPSYKFKKGEQMMSLIDYYKQHYNIVIKDPNQPLLVHRSKKKKTTGETVEEINLLIPELCFLAGLTDSLRKDFRVMKDLASVTKITPEDRKKVIEKFVEQVNKNDVSRKILADWGLELDSQTVPIMGRQLPAEDLYFGRNFVGKSDKADWGNLTGRNHVLRTPNLLNWAIICTENTKKQATDFLATVKIIGKNIGMQVGEPFKCVLPRDDIQNYTNKLKEIIKPPIKMVVIIFPTMRGDKYNAVKRLCCVDKVCASQVIISKTISRADKLKSITEKIVLQMNCKLGGALWALKNPFPNVMVVGIDVYHAPAGEAAKGSVAAFVGSMDKLLTTWHSRVCLQGARQEIVDLLKTCFISALTTYREINGVFPDKIFVYRDGVGDGQFDVVKNFEVKQFLEACSSVEPGYKPKMCVIVVQKRVNTRIFEKTPQQLTNPGPGTIVDSVITRKYLYDFYLVPQRVTQGTVTPTHYVVLHDSADIKTDHVQRFTFKLCHLYYNWPGTIRVPAPCQYAHKLAYLVGQNIKALPHQDLNNTLYYL